MILLIIFLSISVLINIITVKRLMKRKNPYNDTGLILNNRFFNGDCQR